MNNIKLLRRAQTITPFGVGSVIDQDGESFVPADITWWKESGEIIHEPRLEAHLGVKSLRQAPSAPDRLHEVTPGTPGIPCVRFPSWMFCPKCRHMYRIWSDPETPVCKDCPDQPCLIPMRFVMACPRGHLDDVPWDVWAHSNKKTGRCEKPSLAFLTHSGGSGLEFLEIRCLSCNSHRTMAGIATRDSLRNMNIHCPGTQPWQRYENKDTCDAVPQVLQRGATNLTFHVVESSIDIPPYSSWEAYSDETRRVASHIFFTLIRSAYNAGNLELIESCIPTLASDLDMEIETVRKITYLELQGGYSLENRGLSEDKEVSLLAGEYLALLDPNENYHPKDHFIKHTVDLSSVPGPSSEKNWARAISMLKDRLGRVVQVSRLREVRALRGFSRLSPVISELTPDDDTPGSFSVYGSEKQISPSVVSVDLNQILENSRWLPALEVYGEGVFITLNEEALTQWESDSAVETRAGSLVPRRNQGATYLPVPSPRLLLLHTLSHILIRQLSFECGYSVASLRERLYVGNPVEGESMSGVLIYTAAGDSEGTLGGLVRQGRPDRILPTLLTAVQSSTWCSSDPLCQESQGQGLNSLNLAACHACSLLPETSCILSNRLLDRVMLTGSLDGSVPGFFTPIIEYITSSIKLY